MNALASLKASLPFGEQLRTAKRALFGLQSDPGNDEGLLDDATNMVSALHAAGATLAGSTVMEIGTGWLPMLPLVFRMAGASEIITLDQNRLMDRYTFRHAISYIRENLAFVLDREKRTSPHFDFRRLPHRSDGRSLDDLCRVSGITYSAPADFLNAKPGSGDFLVSRTVLEHIPEDILRNIFCHAAKVVRPGGMMCHWVDMSDHYEHGNKSLSRVDLLRYSEQEWQARLAKTPGHYQNRLRRFDYLRLLEETGWEVISATGMPNQNSLKDLKDMQIMPPYTDVPHEELAVLVTMIIARRPSEG